MTMEEDYQQHPGQHQSYCYTNPQDFVQPNQDEDEMLHTARHEIYQLERKVFEFLSKKYHHDTA